MHRLSAALWVLVAACAFAPVTHGAELRVAVAANFLRPMQDLARRFEAASGHNVVISAGSTGVHYAQIAHGAPFDLFFAADAERPRRLEQDGHAIPGTRFTYAIGRIALWSPEPGLVDRQGRVLASGRFRHLAIANPKLAPYGAAARSVLERLGLWRTLQDRLVFAQDIAQAYAFVESGNAEVGFVAYSQLLRPGQGITGSVWEVPQSLYPPIEQQAVLLVDRPAARAFVDFVRSEKARAVIRGYGYRTEDAQAP